MDEVNLNRAFAELLLECAKGGHSKDFVLDTMKTVISEIPDEEWELVKRFNKER